MKIGIIGAGVIGQAIARHATSHGHQVVLSNSRTPDTLTPITAQLGELASAASPAVAAKAEMVVLAVPGSKVAEAVRDLGPWEGQIVVDTTNFATPDSSALPDGLAPSEYVASLMPGARVIKAFNTLYAEYITPDPRHIGGRQVLFFAGDDAEAKLTFSALTDDLGFANVDLGGIRENARLMDVGGSLSALHVLKQD